MQRIKIKSYQASTQMSIYRKKKRPRHLQDSRGCNHQRSGREKCLRTTQEKMKEMDLGPTETKEV